MSFNRLFDKEISSVISRGTRLLVDLDENSKILQKMRKRVSDGLPTANTISFQKALNNELQQGFNTPNNKKRKKDHLSRKLYDTNG